MQGFQERWGIAAEQARLLAHISGGRPGYALRLHQTPELLEARRLRLDYHERLLSCNRAQRFEYAEKLAKDKEALQSTLQTWSSLWRDVLMRAAGSVAPLVNLDRTDEVARLAARFGVYTANDMVAAIQNTSDLLDRNVNSRLAIEVLLLDLPYL
jgi:DNA polymerase-3 subunit delta'